MRLLRRGLLDSPILNRELRALLRSRRSFLWLLVFLVLLLIVFAIAWSNVDVNQRDLSARDLFRTIAISQAVLFSFLAPILTAGSLSGEHERRTYLLLATTPLSGSHVALAKCCSALCYLALLVAASVPILAITFLIGGVAWQEILASAVAMLMTVLVAGMVGVACSAWVRSTFAALILSMVLLVGEFFFAATAAVMFAFPLLMIAFGRVSGRAPGGAPDGLLGVTVAYSAIQFLIFLALTRIARSGYVAGAAAAPVLPKRVIRDRRVLDQRRRRFPYYLIDPLKAPLPIADDANPVYVKDKRHHPMGRTDFLIRISYVFLFISVFLGLGILAQSDVLMRAVDLDRFFATMVDASNLVVALILLAAPLFASTAFTSEKEHGTFASVMTTLQSPSQILGAKLRITLRYSLFLVGALFLPAFFVMFIMRGAPAAFALSLARLFPFYVVLITAATLLGLLVSASSRTSAAAMTKTYLLIALVCVGPWLLESAVEPYGRSPYRLYRAMYSNPYGAAASYGSDFAIALAIWVVLLLAILGFVLLASRRRTARWTVAGVVIVLLFVGPWVSEQLTMGPVRASYIVLVGWAAAVVAHALGPLLSPFCFLAGDRDAWLSALGCYHNPPRIVLYYAFWAVVLAFLYVGAVRALENAVHRDPGPRVQK